MFCPQCGTECKDGTRFCGTCGEPLEAPVPASQAAQPASQAAQPAPTTQPTPATPVSPSPSASADAAAMKPTRSKAPFIVGGIVVLAAVVACLLIFVVKPFGGSSGSGGATGGISLGIGVSADTSVETNNITLGYGYAAGADGWDYFYSDAKHALCRAKTDGSLEVLDKATTDEFGTSDYVISDISVDNDRLFFIKTNRVGGSASIDAPAAAYSMALDGSDAQMLFEGTPGPCQLYVYDHTLYLLVEEEDSAYRLISMDEDGSNQQELCTVSDSDLSDEDIVVTPEKVIYAVNEYASKGQTLGEVYMQNHDGTDFKQVYRSNVGYVGAIAVSGDRLVFQEDNYDAGKHVFTSVAMDGSDAKTVYQVPSERYCMFLTVTDGYLYLAVNTVEGTSEYQLARVSLDGGDVETFDGVKHYYPSACVANGHLVVRSNDGGHAMGGAQVVAVSLEGEDLATYVSLSAS